MDGLECSEVTYTYVREVCDVMRLDSMFYSKQFLECERLIQSKTIFPLKNICTSVRSFGAYSLNNYVEYQNSGIPFIRGVNMKNGIIDFENMLYISEGVNKILYKSEVFPNTVLLSMSGTIGDVGLALPEWKYPINSNQDIAKIRVNPEAISAYYLYAFLRSRFGQEYFIREARGSVQQHVFLSQIENFKIPVISRALSSEIENIVKDGFLHYEKSKLSYSLAQQFLLTTLHFKAETLYTENTAVKSFSESFMTAGRLDAEFYQPKYDQLFEILTAFTTSPLGGPYGIADFRKSIEPGSESYGEEGIPFVRVSDITKFGVSAPEIKLPVDIVEHPEALFPQKDSILFSKDGSVGIAYKLEEDAQFITSSALLQLTIRDTEKVLPDYLTLVLNSPVVQLQAERAASGAVIQHWKPSEIQQVIIPVLDMAEQKKLSQMVQESFSLRRRSEQLLDYAKRAVELAIEQGEDFAMSCLKEKGGNG